MILASTSTVHGGSYLDYISDTIQKDLFKNVSSILFIPYASPGGITHEAYSNKAMEVFSKVGIQLKGIHEFNSAVEAIKNSEGIFVGGGNTFVLMDQLYRNHLISPLIEAINKGTLYLGTSAGSNICGLTIGTTNDMPIVNPKSFKALGLLPFNINPHYLDPIPHSTHMGETRETRINEFHKFNTQPVVGLREGSWLDVRGHTIKLMGNHSARIFEYNKTPYEIKPGSELTNLN